MRGARRPELAAAPARPRSPGDGTPGEGGKAGERTGRKPAGRLLTRVSAIAGALLAASVLALLPATAASAHDYLVSSTPAADSTVIAAVPSVTLVFDDIVLDDGGHGALVQVTDASGRNYESGCATVQDRDVTVPVALGAAGAYRVTWQIVSADGHPVSSSIQFTYQGPAAGTGHDGPLTKCGTKVQAPAAQGTTAATAGPNGSNGSGSASSSGATGSVSPTVVVILVVAGVVVLLAIVAVVLVVVLSGRRRSPQADDDTRPEPPAGPGPPA